MDSTLGRRGFCAVVGLASLSGCMGVLGRERHRIGAVRLSPGSERTWTRELSRNDRIIVEYSPNSDDPSRLVITNPHGNVVLDETLTERRTVRYTVEEDGEYEIHFEWGDRARVNVYKEI